MLTIKPIQSAKDAQHYYSKGDNYYLAEEESLKEMSEWLGKGAQRLGLKEQVNPEVFLELLEGRLPNGQTLGIMKDGERQHRPGTDITLSAAKSVSILALVGKDERILDAQKKAVLKTVEVIEKVAAEARLTVNRETVFEKTGNLSIASFLHTTSRALDPDLHTHLVILNATERADGQWRALSSRDKHDIKNLDHGFRELIYNNQHYFGLVYTATLAKAVKDLGYDINIVDKYGNFEIEGVSKELIQTMSKRRKEVLEELKRTGFTGPKAAEIAALNSRVDKEMVDNAMLQDFWGQEVAEKGANLNEVIFKSKERLLRGMTGLCKQQNQKDMTIPNTIKDPNTVKEALDDAVVHLSQYSAKLAHGALVRLAFSFAAGQIEHEAIEEEIKGRLETKTLEGRHHEYYTSIALQDRERHFVSQMKEDLQDSFALVHTQDSLEDSLLSSSSRTQIVDVKGLVHEKNFLNRMVKTVEGAGLRPYVLHPTRLAANLLSDEVMRESANLWQWFKNQFKEDLVQTVAGFNYHYAIKLKTPFSSKNRNDVIIVNDAQKLSFEDLETLNHLTKESNSKLILLNNTEVTAGFTPGNPIKTLKEAGIQSHQTKTMRRESSLELHIHKNPTDALIAHYQSLSPAQQKEAVLLACNNPDQGELTDKLRAHRITIGTLSKENQDIQVLSKKTLSEAEKKHSKFYEAGDRLIISPFSKQQKQYQITGIDGRCVVGKNDRGVRLNFDIRNPSTPFSVHKKTKINVREGECLKLNENFFANHLKLQKGSQFQVLKLLEDGIEASFGRKKLTLNMETLGKLSLSYDYVAKPVELKQGGKIALVAIDANHINRNLIAECSQISQSLRLFTNDEGKARKNLERAQVSFTVQEIAEQKPSLIYRDMNFAETPIIQDLDFLAKELLKDREGLDKASIAERAVAYAIAKTAERDAAFKHSDLMINALRYAIGDVEVSDIEKILEDRQNQGRLSHLRTFWITKEALAIEKSILASNLKEQNTVSPITSDNKELQGLPEHLTQGQRQAIQQSVTAKDRFTTVQGLAGVGKTTMLQQVQAIAKQNGFEVLGLAPTHRAVAELKSNNLTAQTIDSFLVQDKEVHDKTLIIVDEVSMVGNSNYLALQKKSIENNARIVFTGDMTQLQSLSSGIPHELTVTTKTQQVAKMEEIVRQNPNPALKEAASYASKRQIDKAFKVLETINPEDFVKRRTAESTFKTSVIEIALLKNDDGTISFKPHYEAVAQDYLSRTDEHQDNTLIVVHAHEDRREIDKLVRKGLIDQGKIAEKGIYANRLFAVDMKKADLLCAQNFHLGQVLRFDRTYSVARKGDYFSILEINPEKNMLKCKSEDEKTYAIHPDVMVKHAMMKVYTPEVYLLAIGDKIRMKRTDLQREHFVANQEFRLKAIAEDKTIILENSTGESLKLNLKNKSDQHWDYAYTDTAYGFQGATSKFTINLELDARVKATTHRSHEIDITRASHQAMIYTENKKELVARLNNPEKQRETDKTSAFAEMARFKHEEDRTKCLVAKSIEKATQKKVEQNDHIRQAPMNLIKRADTKDIGQRLQAQIESLSHTLLGEPNHHLSNKSSLRYGKKGSLKVDVTKGVWKNFETGEGGNAFDLIQSTLGFTSFAETLDYAMHFLGEKILIQPITSPKIPIIKTSEKPKDNSKRAYAQKLFEQSTPIANTLAEMYLRKHRSLTQYQNAEMRFLKSIPTIHNDKKTKVPALLAVARDKEGEIHHVQVIRLDKDTGNKDKQSRIIKQTYGSIEGHGVFLNNPKKASVTCLTEGIETGLSILEADKEVRVLALLSKSNFQNVDLEQLTKKVVLCLDNDGDATHSLNKNMENPITKALERLKKNGHEVRIVVPKNPGDDLNDVLKKEGIAGLNKTLGRFITPKEYLRLCTEHPEKILIEPINIKKPVDNNIAKINEGKTAAFKEYQFRQKVLSEAVSEMQHIAVQPKTQSVQLQKEMEL